MEKPVAVIILNWNGEKMLAKYLPQVISATDDTIADVIVADNGSDDGSLELLERSFPDVIVVKLDRNYGFAEGYNRAIAATDYRYTVLLNSDVAPATGWLNPLYDYMEAHPDVGACQPKIRSYADHKSFEYAGACGGFLDRNGYPYCRGRIFDTVERDSGQYDMVIPVFWASGAALMVRSELYVKVGGLDKDFFAHM
ncbi:glycosyltransferase family 2 protein, partial [uncultured Muribaculum sp.]